MKKCCLFLLVFMVMFSGISQNIDSIVPKKVSDINLSNGELMRIESFPSKFIVSRNVDIWLPDNYSSNKKYAVLYMHDGQMLFDSTTTWNKQEWKVDEWATKLMSEKKVKDFIVVAMWNIPDIRHSDYFPNKPLGFINKDSILENTKGFDLQRLFKADINSDNYLKFIVEEVKPFVDKTFSVLTDREDTFIAGSSMGGLISMYAVCEYPQVFGGAACISTHWPGILPSDNNPVPQAFFQYMRSRLPDPKSHKMYFDYGTETLDQYYPQYSDQVDAVFLNGGYDDTNFKNLKFEGKDHSENSWNQRLDIPLLFLLSKENE
ncbi:alpha/beta hydrolase-fold protein [Gaetbulibacter sp. M235]|uniref:alpha/beta hydrolase n=1 Tax=Gaetbulibacter sp. M235 TaxID=3126510 RepID=UPI00374EE1F7